MLYYTIWRTTTSKYQLRNNTGWLTLPCLCFLCCLLFAALSTRDDSAPASPATGIATLVVVTMTARRAMNTVTAIDGMMTVAVVSDSIGSKGVVMVEIDSSQTHQPAVIASVTVAKVLHMRVECNHVLTDMTSLMVMYSQTWQVWWSVIGEWLSRTCFTAGAAPTEDISREAIPRSLAV